MFNLSKIKIRLIWFYPNPKSRVDELFSIIRDLEIWEIIELNSLINKLWQNNNKN